MFFKKTEEVPNKEEPKKEVLPDFQLDIPESLYDTLCFVIKDAYKGMHYNEGAHQRPWNYGYLVQLGRKLLTDPKVLEVVTSSGRYRLNPIPEEHYCDVTIEQVEEEQKIKVKVDRKVLKYKRNSWQDPGADDELL